MLRSFFSCLGCALVLFACEEKACTMMGCQDGVTFELSSSLPSGQYVFDVITPEGTGSCTMTLEGSSFTNDCSGTVVFEPSPSSVLVHGTPETVSIEIRSADSHVLTSATVTPNYTDHYPNGPDCDPEPCRVAQAAVAVELPGDHLE